MAIELTINGQDRTFTRLASPASLLEVLAQMSLKADRIAVEHNGEIAPKSHWCEIAVSSGDKLEIVHFVGGGLPAPRYVCRFRPISENSNPAPPPAREEDSRNYVEAVFVVRRSHGTFNERMYCHYP